MKQRYINKKLRSRIAKRIDAHVLSTIQESEGGQERTQLISSIEYKLRLYFKHNVPKAEREILKKHNLLDFIEELYFELSDDGTLKDPWSTSRDSVLKIEFENPILIPKHSNRNLFVVNIINGDAHILSACVALYKVDDALDCEVKEISASYKQVIKRYRTVRTLTEAFPSLAKFIPEDDSPEIKIDPTREEKIIKEFEKGDTANVCS